MCILTARQESKLNSVSVPGNLELPLQRCGGLWQDRCGDIRSSVFHKWKLSCFLEIQTEMFNKQLYKPFRSSQEVQTGDIQVYLVAIGC